MRTTFKKTNKMISFFVAVLMMFNVMMPNAMVVAKANDEIQIAGWDYASIDAVASATLPATSGSKKLESVLSNSQGIAPKFSASSLVLNNWDSGADTKYWQMRISTEGYENIKLSAKTRSSATGPRDFKLTYSIDGGDNWVDIEDSAYQIGSTTLSYFLPQNFALPQDSADVESLLIRVMMASDIALNGSAVASGGASNINNISITGTPKVDDSITGYVKATPGSSEILLGQEITLVSDTSDATIYYTINDGEEQIYDVQTPIVAQTLPLKLTTYAKAEGLKDSVAKTYNYTQARVQNVVASPNGGAISLGSVVTLDTKTEGAQIYYSLDDQQTWNLYEQGITLTSLPASIHVYAEKAGMVSSPIVEFKFSQRENSSYGIYFGQLHSHTNNSDGAGSLDDAYSWAKNNANVDFLAVTDHSNSLDKENIANINNAQGSTKWANGLAAADRYTDAGFVGMYAYEMTWSNGLGHINTFNTDGFESRTNKTFTGTDAIKNYYAALKQAPSSLSQLNHPGATFGDFEDFGHYDAEIDELISLIEVGNGEGAIRSSGYFPSYEYYTRALDKGWHVSPTNNQDNHKAKWGNSNTARTVILADSLTRDNVYDALKNRRTYASEDENLSIYYTLNGEVMGTILPEKPGTVNIKVDVEDPDGEAIGTVSVISNGGAVLASQKVSSAKETVEFNLPGNNSYYYIKIVQDDKDIAVTAPVWTGEVEKAGVSKSYANTTMPIKGEEFKMTTDFFNNEATSLEVERVEYSISGTMIHTSDAAFSVPSLATKAYTFNYIPERAGKYDVNVKVYARLNGVEKVYTDVIKLDVADPAVISRVLIDGTHFNDYVSGYYANNMGNFTQMANAQGFAVQIETKEITEEMLANTELLVITAPAKKAGNANGIAYQPQRFSDEFIEMVARYIANGGDIMVTSLANYQDGAGEYSSEYQMNRLLAGIGATSKISKDQVVDFTEFVGTQSFRLSFDDYNMESPLLNGLVEGQKYSFYSGSSVTLDPEAIAQGRAHGVVYGHPTTLAEDSKGIKDENGRLPIIKQEGDVVAMGMEYLPGGGKLYIGGTVYFSDFEVKPAVDNIFDLPSTNNTIVTNILKDAKKALDVTTIEDVIKGNKGEVFVVEGRVTSSTLAPNAFFDSIYIQDETAGINLFPISGTIKLGQTLRVVGSLSEYEGERQLNVSSYEVIDQNYNKVAPTLLSTKDAMLLEHVGTLIKVEGVITDVRYNEGNLDSIYVRDDSGEVARVFVNGYIGYSDETSQRVEEFANVGTRISAVGLGSIDPEGPRLRVRDRSEIIKLDSEIEEVPTYSDGWHEIDGEWYYYTNNKKQTGWLQLGNIWYYLQENGVMATEWKYIENTWYYFLGNGHMAKGWQEIAGTWYYLQNNGAMATGWLKLGNVTYYLETSGAMVSGWKYINQTWYYFLENGHMAVNREVDGWVIDGNGVATPKPQYQNGWNKKDGIYYYYQNGSLVKGWFSEFGNKYYLDPVSGAMATGWTIIDGRWYYFYANGKMGTGWVYDGEDYYYLNATGDMKIGWYLEGTTWYYLEKSGRMQTGWRYIDNVWYYFYSSGAMATNTEIDGWIINGSGAARPK